MYHFTSTNIEIGVGIVEPAVDKTAFYTECGSVVTPANTAAQHGKTQPAVALLLADGVVEMPEELDAVSGAPWGKALLILKTILGQGCKAFSFALNRENEKTRGTRRRNLQRRRARRAKKKISLYK